MSCTNKIWDPDLTGATDRGFWLHGHWYPIIRGGSEGEGDGAGGTGDGDAGDGSTGGDNSDGSSTDKGDGSSKTTDEDVKFTDAQQKRLDEIVGREKAKAGRGRIDPKEHGFADAKELADFLEKAKKADADNMEEGEKLFNEAVEEAKAEARADILGVANTRLVKAEFLIQAAKQGVTYADDAFDLAQKLGDDWDVEVDDDGNVTGIDEDLFKALKKAKPFLWAAENGAGGDIGAGRRNAGDKGAARAEELHKKYPALPGGLPRKRAHR